MPGPLRLQCQPECQCHWTQARGVTTRSLRPAGPGSLSRAETGSRFGPLKPWQLPVPMRMISKFRLTLTTFDSDPAATLCVCVMHT